MKQNWLNDTLMNLLVDYYPEVPFRPYGSGATRRNVLPFLKQLGLGYLCIYAKGHGGRTTWRSSLGTAHPRLARDMPAFFRRVTRETGTKLVLYYSGLIDGVAGDRHPRWRMHNADGSDRRLFADFPVLRAWGLCPQSDYFDRWVAVQLRELIGQYDPDGIWVDGDWPGPCYCPRCRDRFRRESGWRGGWDRLRRRPGFAAAYWRVWTGIESEWRERFNGLVKQLKPGCLYSAGNVSPRREYLAPFDWRSGDFFSPGYYHLHDIARMMRWYTTLGVPYDAFVCDTSFTHARKQVRSRSKTLDRMRQEAATVAANGGAVGYWTYPLGNGAWVPSRLSKAVAVRQFLAARDAVFRHTTSAARTAILVADPATPTFGGAEVAGAHKALAALHRSPDLLDETGVGARMPYDLVVLPDQPALDPATAAVLEAWLRRGGNLLSTGRSIESPALRRWLGVGAVRRAAVRDGHVFLSGDPEPVGVDAPWDRIETGAAATLSPLYRSWDQDNPAARALPNNWPMHGQVDEEHPERAGFPAAIRRRVGRGAVVHVPTTLFASYYTLGDPQLLRWIRALVDGLDPRPWFATDAPSWVDVSLRRRGGRLLIHLVNQNPGRDVAKLGTDDTWVDEIPAVGPITLRLQCARRPRAVRLVPAGGRLAVRWGRGALTVVVPRLQIHACVAIADTRE